MIVIHGSSACRFDCPIETSELLVTCLQSVNFHLLDEMYFTFFVSLSLLKNVVFKDFKRMPFLLEF